MECFCFCLSFKMKDFLSTRFCPERLSAYSKQFLAVFAGCFVKFL